jgi:hypothetical protein
MPHAVLRATSAIEGVREIKPRKLLFIECKRKIVFKYSVVSTGDDVDNMKTSHRRPCQGSSSLVRFVSNL